jgi:diguanylate cyclase (GGDEF)-like protein
MLVPDDRQRRLQSRLERERRARREAEQLLESKSRELYEANRALSQLAEDLEKRVEARTHELSVERQMALAKAEIDALTGVCNRTAFDRKLTEALHATRDGGERLAVLLIDLDDFKLVNDTLGHAAGDALLVEFASRLSQAVRPQDVVGRLGGDEFALVARCVVDRDGALLMAHRLLRALCRPIVINGRSVPCSCSIGLAESDSRHCIPDVLLSDADLALYASKRKGPGRVTCFETALRVDVERRAALDAELREAVDQNRLEPWYQPIWRFGEQSYVGAEVLTRWRSRDGSVRPPAAFLSSIEELGLLDNMMDSVLRLAFKEAAPIVSSGSLDYLSINVSPSQFDRGWTQNQLPALLAETQFPAQSLVVEITETALVHDIDRTRATLMALTAQGVRIALDDFGVGYSNFSLLGKLPFDILKLDRTLICDIETDNNAHALAECVLALASRLNIKVTAEGVETKRQADMLIASGCTTMQGYWIARPHRHLGHWPGSIPERDSLENPLEKSR